MPRRSQWTPRSTVPALRPGEVHVWSSGADLPSSTASSLLTRLDLDERQRADRFRDEGARRRFVAARVALRTLAAGYLGEDPGVLRFVTGPRGKPELGGAHAGAGLRFNLSHSGDRVLLAFCRDSELGIDVEPTARAVDWERITRRYFSAAERAALAALPSSQRSAAFLAAWCCKEAVAKLVGTGLTNAVLETEVPIPIGRGQLPVTLPGRGSCFLRRLEPGAGYVAALASDLRSRAVRRLEWRPPR